MDTRRDATVSNPNDSSALADESDELASLRLAVRRYRTVAEASRAIAQAGNDRDEILSSVATRLASELGDGCVIRLLSEDGVWLHPAAIAAGDAQSEADFQALVGAVDHRASEGLAGRVIATGEPILVPGTPSVRLNDAVKPEYRELIERYDVRSMVIVPLRGRDRVLGTLAVSRFRRGDLYTRDDVDLLQDLADRAGLAIENVTLRQAVERADAYHRGVLDGVADAILVLDEDGRYIDANPAAEELFGYSREELRGMCAADLAPIHRPTAHRTFKEFVESHDAGEWWGEWSARRRDGRVIPLEGRSSIVRLPDGSNVVIGSNRDITERKRAEDAIRATEARYRTLIENIPAVTYIETVAPESRAIYMSAHIEALVGYTPDEFLRDPGLWRGIIHPDDRERTDAEIARTDATGEPFHLDHRYLARDGRAVWVRNDAVLVHDESGRPTHWQGFLFDITAEKQAEEALRESEERFRSAFEDAAVAMAIARVAGPFIRVNDAFARMLGYDHDELARMTFRDITHPDDLDTTNDHIARMRRGDMRSFRIEKRYRHKDGHAIWGLLSLSSFQVGNEPEPFVIAQVQDITDLKRAEAEVRAEITRREEFLSIAAHELKTPLTSIKASSQLLSRRLEIEPFDAERLRMLVDQQQGQISRLEHLVSDLLDVSRIQRGRLDLRREPFDLAELAREVVERFEQAPERTPAHHLRVDAPHPVSGEWDRLRLDQVITNLLSNALKYSPEGGEVVVGLHGAGDEIELTVQDNGIGIGEEMLEQLFTPFARREYHVPVMHGTGLGLYITRQIVEHHGGEISVESHPGHGTTFSVKLRRILEHQ